MCFARTLENIINRDFQAAAPNEKWLTDRVPDAGWQGVSLTLIDCFDGLVISLSIGRRPDADHVNTMLDAAMQPSRRWPIATSGLSSTLVAVLAIARGALPHERREADSLDVAQRVLCR